MTSIYRKLPKVNSLLGCNLPREPRPFGVGLVDDDPDQAAWRDAVDRGHYEDEPPTDETPDEIPVGEAYWSDELSHLESLLTFATPLRRAEIERRIDSVLAMLGLPAPARKPRLYEPDVNDRIWWAQVREQEEREGLERQLAASWAMSEIEAGAERFDGRYTDEDAFNTGACG